MGVNDFTSFVDFGDGEGVKWVVGEVVGVMTVARGFDGGVLEDLETVLGCAPWRVGGAGEGGLGCKREV